MAMADDPLGLGIEGIGFGGFAEGFSINGVDLSHGLASRLHASSSSSSSQSSSAYKAANSAQRKKLVSDLVELLEKHRSPHSFDQFVQLSTFDLSDADNAKLLDDLSKNTKVTVDTAKRTIAYKVRAALASHAPLRLRARTDRLPLQPPAAHAPGRAQPHRHPPCGAAASVRAE